MRAVHDFQERERILIVADPRSAEDLRDRLGLPGLEEDLELLIQQSRSDAERLFPHGGERQRYPPMVVVGVVPDLHLQRVVRAVARLPVQSARFLESPFHGPVGPVRRRRTVVRYGGNIRVGRKLAGTRNLPGQDFAIDDHRQRSAQPGLVLEGRPGHVEAEIIATEIGRNPELRREILPDPVQLLVGERLRPVELPGPVSFELHGGVLDGIEVHGLDAHVVRVMVVGVLHEPYVRLHDLLVQYVGAVGDQPARTREAIPVLLDVGRIDGKRRRMRQQFQEVRRRTLEADDERPVIDRLHAQRLGR